MRDNLLKKQPTWGLRRAQGTGQKSATPATLTKVILVLLTMFLLPSAAWGQGTVTVTKTIQFNKVVNPVTSNIDNSMIPVSVSEVVGGTPYTYNSNVYIKDDNAIEQYSSSEQGGAVFKVNNDATSDMSSIIIIIPGNYPIVPTMVKLKFKYANAIGDIEDPDDDYNAIIHVCDYTTGDTPDLRYKTTVSNLDKTTNPLIFSAEGKPVTVGGETITGEGGTDREDGPKSLWIMAYLDGNPEAEEEEERTTFTITEVEITYDINESDVYGLTVAGVPVTNVNASAVLFDKENWGGDYEEVKGTVSFTPAGTNPATLTLNNANITVDGKNAIESGLGNLTVNLVGDQNVITCQGSTDCVFKGTVSGAKVTFTTDATTPGVLISYVSQESNMFVGIEPIFQNGLNFRREGDSYYIDTKVGLMIGDNAITYANIGSDGTITGISGISSGTVKFTPADNTTTPATPATLTLDNATLGTYIKSTIKDLKVYLVGNNTITSSDGAFIYNGTESNPILTFSTVDPSDYENLGMLTINGISSTDNIASGYAIKGLVGETSTAINDWGEDRSSTLDTSVSGWKYEENSTPSQAFVKLLYREVYDLWISSHRYYSGGLSYSSEIFNPATSTLTFNNIHGDTYQIYSGLTALTIEIGGDNELKAISFGAPNGETIGATSGTLTIKKDETSTAAVHELTLANADTDGGVISGFSSVTIEEPMGVKSPSPFTTWGETHNAVISDAQYYDLWVGGVQVTSGNASDILGAAQSSQSSQPTAVFDAENSILTLNGLQIDYSSTNPNYIESGLENLTVILSGENKFMKGGDVTTCYGFKALEGETRNITFTATAGKSFSFIAQVEPEYAVSGFSKVTYKDNLGAITDDNGYFHICEELSLVFDTAWDDNNNPTGVKIESSGEIVSHKIVYAIDYAKEDMEDIPETEYTDVIPLATITAGPCIFTAYTLSLDGENTKSNNLKYYYFQYSDSEVIIGNGTTIDLKDYLLPTLTGEDEVLLYNSSDQSGSIISINSENNSLTGIAYGTAIVSSSTEGVSTFTFYDSGYEPSIKVTVQDIIDESTFASGQSYGTFFNTTEAYNVPEELKAYIITDVNEAKGTIEMTETSVLPPNTPVLMYRTSTTVSPNYVFTKASNVEPVTTKLKYTTTDKPAEESSKLYVLYNGQFVKVTSGTKILANHCYLDLANTSSGTRSYYDIDGSDGTTGIREVKSEGVKGEKWADSAWHDLQGRKFTTKPTKPGLYILNGKKVVVK